MIPYIYWNPSGLQKMTTEIQPHMPFGLSTEQSTSLRIARNDGGIANDRTLLGARLSVVLIIVIPRQLLILGIARLKYSFGPA